MTSARLWPHLARLRKLLQLYEAEPAQAARFRAQQLEQTVRMAPLVLLANAVNAAVLLWLLWRPPVPWGMVVWTLMLVVLSAQGLRLWRLQRQGRLRPTASPKVLTRACWQAALLGGVWACMPAIWMPQMPLQQALVPWIIVSGMTYAGSFSLMTMPWAGTIYIAMLACGALIGVLRTDYLHDVPILPWLICFYSLVSIVSTWVGARIFGQRLMTGAQTQRQSEVIGMLLRDFADHSSDILWETQADGRPTLAGHRLAGALGLDPQTLHTRPLWDWLETLCQGVDLPSPNGLPALRRCLDARRPVRDHLIALQPQGSGVTQYWSLTAKPVWDEEGTFAGWRGVAADVTQTHETTQQLTYLAHFDTLTGLLNRNQFCHGVHEALTQLQQRPGQGCAVLCIDLDHFKATNDTLGHAAGDALLAEVGRRLRAGTRRQDLTARLGGDEFAVLLADPGDAENVRQTAERLLEALQQPYVHEGRTLPIRCSIGIALAPKHGSALDEVMNNADLALYDAKASGRATLRFFDVQMASHTRRQHQIEQALRRALAGGEFRLVYQPQVDLARWQVTGFEALLRWHSGELGEVSPMEFIPVAEASGLIGTIGAWVLEEACREAAGWPQGLHVAVNVSPAQVAQSGFVAQVAHTLATHGFATQRLELEITESVFLRDSEAALAVLGQLRALGLRIALDDFGTGYSSLAYLRSFPFDTLKIDRAFVREVLTRHDARAIIKTILGLAETLKMHTVAEGVEDLAQVPSLQRHGCHAIQGYGVARPMPPHEVPAFLRQWASAPPLQHTAESLPDSSLLPL